MKLLYLVISTFLSTCLYSQKLVRTYWDYLEQNIQSEYYTDAYGVKNGMFKGYSEYGGILMQGVFKNNKPIGKWIENYTNGKLHFIKIYDSPGNSLFDVIDGKIISYYEDGKTIKYERNFKNLELEGVEKEYYEDGTLKFEGINTNGQFEYTGESKKKHDEEQEILKQKKIEEEQKKLEVQAAIDKKNKQDYDSIIIESDKALENLDYEKAIELYSSASRILRDEKYPTKKIAEIIEISNLNKKFFNDFLNIQKDSLKLDKLYFNKHLSLKIIKTNNGSKFTIDENGDEIELFDDSIYNLEKPWENLDWNVSNSCFLKNEKVYNQIQILVTKHYFKFLELLKIEEVNTNGNYYELNFYNKSTFLDHITNGKKAYNLAKSLIELEILKTEIKKLQFLNILRKKPYF
jgi:hypothetical protein